MDSMDEHLARLTDHETYQILFIAPAQMGWRVLADNDAGQLITTMVAVWALVLWRDRVGLDDRRTMVVGLTGPYLEPPEETTGFLGYCSPEDNPEIVANYLRSLDDPEDDE